MAQPQLTPSPFSGSEKEIFRKFELLLRSTLAVAALPANQQANFLQLNHRDAALRLFQTLLLATGQNFELSITALRDRFCNPQLKEVHVLKLKNMKFDSKTDTLEKFLVMLQTKATKIYPDPTRLAVAPIDPHAADVAVEQTEFDQETALRAKTIHSAQAARSRQFIKNQPGWLGLKLLEQPKKNHSSRHVFLRENKCQFLIFAKQTILSWTRSTKWVTNTLVTTLTKLSTSEGAMEN